MSNISNPFFVLTGGPGSGKSTLIDALAIKGFATSVEAGRGVIQNQVVINGPALPWKDPAAFAELMLCWEMRSYHMALQQNRPVFFDRGVPDIVGYLNLMRLQVPDHIELAAMQFRYNPRVFIAPPWPEIFQQDAERKQDFAEAKRTYEAMISAYTQQGYELIELPLISVHERVEFILSQIQEALYGHQIQ